MSQNKKESTQEPEMVSVDGLKVVSKRDGFYRAGVSWTGETKVPVSDFTDEQVQLLRDEPMLIVSNCKVKVPATSAE